MPVPSDVSPESKSESEVADDETSPLRIRGVLRGLRLDGEPLVAVRKEREEAEEAIVMSSDGDEGRGGGRPMLRVVELDWRERRGVRLLGVV